MSDTGWVVIERSPADVVRVVVAAVALIALLLIEWLFGDTLVGFVTEVLSGLGALPQWIVDLVVGGTRLLALVMVGAGVVGAVVRARWAALARVVAAGLLAAALVTLFDGVVEVADGVAPTAAEIRLGLLDEGFPSALAIGMVAAALTAAAPWLSRRWRRAGWALLVGLLLTQFMATQVSFDPIEATIIGWLCGAGVLALAGAPSRRPTREAVIAGLAGVGMVVEQLDRASVDARGSTPYFGVAAGGERLFVKALGDDERSADLLFRLWRRITPRDFGDEKPFSTLRRAVEHEAFVALAARELGVRTPRVRAFTSADPNGYVVAYEAIAGKSLDRLDAGEIDDNVVTACWRLVGQLRDHRIAHRDLRLANIFLDERGDVWLIDFGFSEMAAADRLLANDVAELVASSSIVLGPERAVAHAAAAVDPVTLRRTLERLRPWALSGATRAALKARPGHLDELQGHLRDAVGRSTSGAER